jgi:hypothetical protein
MWLNQRTRVRSSRTDHRSKRLVSGVQLLPNPLKMDLTAEEVDTIEQARQIVEDLREYAEAHPESVFDSQNLQVLEVQLDGLHQGLSMAVAQKRGLENVDIGGDDADE